MTVRALRKVLAVSAGVLLVVGCASNEPDAYGNFEATEVTVSAETGGQLLVFNTNEGDTLANGVVVGQIDTTAASLQRRELVAQRAAARLRTTESGAQTDVLQTQLATAETEYQRVRRLYQAEAATARQLNEAEGAVKVLRAKIDAAQVSTGVAQQETGGADARIAQLSDQIDKGRIVNPVAGTVLTTYVEPGEFVQPGEPLYKIADLDTLELRVYVSGSQLAGLKLGAPVQVRVDSAGGGFRDLSGRISWIASSAEFTPTPIQTRDERVSQVYAVKVRVANPDGVAKIGMPADVTFGAAERQ